MELGIQAIDEYIGSVEEARDAHSEDGCRAFCRSALWVWGFVLVRSMIVRCDGLSLLVVCCAFFCFCFGGRYTWYGGRRVALNIS